MLIPFSSSDPVRQANFSWLKEYWKYELPSAEIILGVSKGEIFCKAEALNDAVRKSRGRVLVIMDADAYIEGSVISACADSILGEKNPLWYVPYRKLYRLTEAAGKMVTDSRPTHPFRFPPDMDSSWIENTKDSIYYGHYYGAMSMVFPREAYDAIGGFDERFKGWGGEDVCILRAFDTLFAKHKTMDASMYHIWHPFYGKNYIERRWEGQEKGGSNWALSKEYGKAEGSPTMMRQVINSPASAPEGIDPFFSLLAGIARMRDNLLT